MSMSMIYFSGYSNNEQTERRIPCKSMYLSNQCHQLQFSIIPALEMTLLNPPTFMLSYTSFELKINFLSKHSCLDINVKVKLLYCKTESIQKNEPLSFVDFCFYQAIKIKIN